jgi:hypothetical protein
MSKNYKSKNNEEIQVKSSKKVYKEDYASTDGDSSSSGSEEKDYMARKSRIEKPIKEKKPFVMTEKRIEAFKKAREIRADNIKLNNQLKEKEIERVKYLKQQVKDKKEKKIKKIERQIQYMSSDSEESKVSVVKSKSKPKPKKKREIVYQEDSSSSDDEPTPRQKKDNKKNVIIINNTPSKVEEPKKRMGFFV